MRAREREKTRLGRSPFRAGMARRARITIPAPDVAYFTAITIESGPASGSTRVCENPASFIHP